MDGIFLANLEQPRAGQGKGNANARVMRKIVGGMERHASEIGRLDASRPLLPQFDLLIDEQVRALFRALDRGPIPGEDQDSD